MVIIPLIDLYATACDWLVAGLSRPPDGLYWFLIVSYFNGIVVEVGRKIRSPQDEEPGVETYSALWGRTASTTLWMTAIAVTALVAWQAAVRIHFERTVVAILVVLVAACLLVSLRFLRTPAKGAGKNIEIAAGIWTLLMYLEPRRVASAPGCAASAVKVILRPGEVSEARLLGGKARALDRLAQARLPVPPWFVVSPDAFWTSLGDETSRVLRLPEDEQIAQVIDKITPAPEVRAAIAEALAQLSSDGSSVAVRSSASDEDGVEHSFAGQLETFLFVRPEDVANRVAAVWRSGFSARLLAYRRQHGLERVRATRRRSCSAHGRVERGRRRIQRGSRQWPPPHRGGERGARAWHRPRFGRVRCRHVAGRSIRRNRRAKRRRQEHRSSHAMPSAPKVCARSPCRRTSSRRPRSATSRSSGRGAGAARRASFWPTAGYRVGVVENAALPAPVPARSRPSCSQPIRTGTLIFWDNSNIVESYSGVTTPLTFSFASEIYEHVYRQFCRMMRVPAAQIDRARPDVSQHARPDSRAACTTTCSTGIACWRCCRGSRINRRFMEQMMGVREGLPDAMARSWRHVERSISAICDGAVTWSTAFRDFVVHHFTDRLAVRGLSTSGWTKRWRRLRRRWPTAGPTSCVAHYRDLRDRLLLHWDAPLVNDFFAMIFYGVLRKLTQAWCDDTEGTLQNDLDQRTGWAGQRRAGPASARVWPTSRAPMQSFARLLVNASGRTRSTRPLDASPGIRRGVPRRISTSSVSAR